MIPPRFEYFAPATIEEAVGLLDRYGGEAKVLAGGQSLLPVMKLRLAEPKALIDINRIPNLAYIREDDRFLRIGATTHTADLLESSLLAKRYPILTDASHNIADPLVRNIGTVGGNVSHGDPANDLPACMMALEAHYVVRGPRGERTVPATDFYVNTFVTVLEPNEILTEIRVPRARAGQGNAYFNLEKRAGDFPIAGVAANLFLGSQGTIERARIALTSVGATALHAAEAGGSLTGQAPNEASFRKAADLAMAHAKPTKDLRGPVDYKKAMVRVLALRALRRAVERARGGA